MSPFVRFGAGIVVCALALCATVVRPQSYGPAAPQRPGPVRPDWKLGTPATSENLTIFPVTSLKWANTEEFITLDEGLKSGGVIISELGGGGIIRGRGAQVRSAEVNTLSLINRSGRTLVLLAGELLIGGKQDRIVDHDRLVPSSDLAIALGVFCVEHGRWQGETATFGGSRPAPAAPPRGGHNFMPMGGGGGLPGQIANPSVREKAEAKKSQSEVWKQVSDTVGDLDARSSTGALTRIYEDKKQMARLHAAEKAIKDKIAGKTVVGVVVMINGQLVATDIFPSPSMFQSYWPKLLSSYALEAFGAGKKPGIDPSWSNPAEFLCRVEGEISSEGTDGVYRLTEHKTMSDSSFELEALGFGPPFLVHFNRIATR